MVGVSRIEWAVVALLALAVLLFVAAIALLVASVWATGETGGDLFLTACILGGVAPFVGIAAFALAGLS